MNRMFKLIILAGVSAFVAAPASALDGNADAGAKVFTKCAACHGIGDKPKPIAPTLNNVIGRTAGTDPDYLAKGAAGYSKALIAAGQKGLVWTDDEILSWLTGPSKKVPGTKMAFPGLPKEQDRADVLAYIKTFSKQP